MKSLLVAAGLFVGASAWAEAGDVTTNANIDFSNPITDGVVAGTVNSIAIGGSSYIDADNWLRLVDATSTVTIPEAQRAGSKDVVNIKFKMGWGNKNGMGSKFEIKDADNKALASFSYARWGSSATNYNDLDIDMTGLVGAQSNNAPIKARYTLFDITFDYSAKTITSVVFCSDTNGKGATKTETFNTTLTNTNPIASFEVSGFGVGGNTDRADAIDEIVITTTEGDYSVVTYDYTVNWVCNGTTVKSAIRQGEKDAEISLPDTDKAPFAVKGTKYFYVSDDVEGKTVLDDGSTVVTVTVREAETWNYTIKAVDESEKVLETITTGTVVEGESIYYYYPTFFLNGTDLLQADINDKTYGKGATPTENNAEYTVVYKDKGISDIVFYKEAEDIEGMTTVTAGNVPARCSNGKGASASTATKIVTLAPGKYKISGFAWGNSGTNFNVTANGANIATFTTASSTVNVTTSDEFTLTGTTDIVMGAGGNGGSSPKVIDFFYVQKTGDVELPANASVTVTAAGYATYCSEYDLNLSGVKAYTATLSGSDVTFTQQTGKVVAGTGLLIKADAGTVNIPVVAEGAAAVADNALVGVLANTVVGAGSFVLMNGAQGVGFYKTTADEFTVGAHTAYIAALPAAARSFIGFDFDATTGIEAVAAEKSNGEVYNLNGQRVNAPQKGLYIVNGKKVVVK